MSRRAVRAGYAATWPGDASEAPPGPRPLTAPARLSISRTRAAYIGSGLQLSAHRNVTATLALALHEPFDLTLLDGSGVRQTRHVTLIPPGTRHQLHTRGDMLFLYLDALGDDHRQLSQLDLAAARDHLLQHPHDVLQSADVDRLCALLGVPTRLVDDPRIALVIRRLDACPQDFSRIADAAALAGLSVSRFQALFRRSLGVPFRPYRLWRRMAVMVEAVAAGDSLTDAALSAGFASSAHLSATFRTMFGVTPSRILTRGLLIQRAMSAADP